MGENRDKQGHIRARKGKGDKMEERKTERNAASEMEERFCLL